jgi:hypothetical protein
MKNEIQCEHREQRSHQFTTRSCLMKAGCPGRNQKYMGQEDIFHEYGGEKGFMLG